ncbi:CHAT domain-containing protein [Streptomyces sp. NPDC059837]|uniref:CHAT domain-containing protein n=1 Tax=Streptomyces sp. NPDC059837 TaxID=3346968 RepID=UPI0036505938
MSVFDPFAPRSGHEPLHDWLAQRNRLDHDEEVIEYVIPLSALFSTGISAWRRLALLPRAVLSWYVSRPGRSGRHRIGLYECDLIAVLERILWWRVLGPRTLVVALALAVCLRTGTPGWAAVAFPAMVWAVTGWRPARALVLVVPVLIWTARIAPDLLYLALPGVAAAEIVWLMVSLQRTGMLASAPAHSPVRFLGPGFLLRALWDPTAARVVLAVDKATHDDRARTACFAEAGRGVPRELRPVLVQCRALVEAGRLEFQAAMVLSETARSLAADAPPRIRGWCALHAGDVLLAAGQPAAAEARWREAGDLLAGVQAARYWAAEAELRMGEALTTDLADTERCLEGLRLLCRTRHAAVRTGNLAVLARTEMLLLRLMHEAGNTIGVVEQLLSQHERMEGTVDLGTSVADHAAQTLLLATLYLDIVENPERHPEADRVDSAGRHERYEHAGSLMDGVLRHLSRSRMPLLEAHAYAVLARIQHAVGQREEALGNALESLGAVQRVRYQLPTAAWRAHWVASHARTYALALDLAASDPALVSELLETVRAQSVPVESDAPGGQLRAVLDALVSSTGLPPGPEGAAGEQRVTTDPLLTDRTITVGQASFVGGPADGAVDLDGELTVMHPGGWYWSYARVGEWLYHSVRSPEGRWYTERRPHHTFAPAYQDLVMHLPVRLPDVDKPSRRLPGTALTLAGADDPVAVEPLTAGQVWARIFDALGAAMVPTVLREALLAAPEPVPLVVAPTGALALVPVCALTLTPQRTVLDVAEVAYLPSVALLSQSRRRTLRDAPPPLPGSADGPAPALAVLAPDRSPEHPRQRLRHALRTVPENSEVVTGPLPRTALAELLAREGMAETVLCLAGHVNVPTATDPGSSGFRFSDGLWGLHELYRTDARGAPHYRMPHRVLLAACASLGLYGQPDGGHAPALLDVPEWLGVGAAAVHGGARHVYCTLFELVDCEPARRIDLALVDALRHRARPAGALRAVQRAELHRWRNGHGSLPLAFLAYAYVGLGEAEGKALPAATAFTAVRPAPTPGAVPRQESSRSAPTAPTGKPVRPQPARRAPHEPFIMMKRHAPDGSGSRDDVLYPCLGPDGQVRFTPFDGEAVGPVPVRGAVWTREDLDLAAFRATRSTEWRIFGLRLYITDARLVLVSDKPDAKARRIAGHLRYPWVNSIGFRPKQSFLNDCEVVVETQQEGTETTCTSQRLTLLFDDATDSGRLARLLVRRLASHHLADDTLPTSVRQDFEALREPPVLPPPRKGEHATYRSPAFKCYPYGAEYLLGQPPEGTWIGPGLPTQRE